MSTCPGTAAFEPDYNRCFLHQRLCPPGIGDLKIILNFSGGRLFRDFCKEPLLLGYFKDPVHDEGSYRIYFKDKRSALILVIRFEALIPQDGFNGCVMNPELYLGTFIESEAAHKLELHKWNR